MGLPRVDTPVHEMTLTSNNKKIKFRPFLVKEEKLLLMALESKNEREMVLTMKQIIENCLLSDINVDTLPMFDVQHIFLQLRAKSVGEIVEVTLRHPNGKNKKEQECDGSEKIKIDISKISPKSDNTHNVQIKINDKIGLQMKYPTMEIYNEMSNLYDIGSSENTIESIFDIIVNSIDYIYQDEEIFYAREHSKQEMHDFLNSLNSDQFENVRNFFKTMPNLTYTHSFKCSKCNTEEELLLEGIEDFFS